MHQIINEASFTGLFRLILIVLTVYLVYSLIIRIVLPSLMRKYVNDFQKRYSQQNQPTRNDFDQKKEGEISITYINKDKNNSQAADSGEYVDYEEIK